MSFVCNVLTEPGSPGFDSVSSSLLDLFKLPYSNNYIAVPEILQISLLTYIFYIFYIFFASLADNLLGLRFFFLPFFYLRSI